MSTPSTGTIYDIPTLDQVLIMPARSFFLRKFNAGNWTQLKIGALISVTTSGGDNTNPTTEFVSTTNATSFCFGIKNYNTTIPGDSGAYFIGHRKTGTSDGAMYRETGAQPSFQGRDGSQNIIPTVTANTTITTGGTDSYMLGANPADNVAQFIGIALEWDATNSTVTLNLTNQTNTATANPSAATLSSLMDSTAYMSFSAAGRVTLSTTGLPSRPDAFFINWPWSTCRLRLHAIGVKKYS